MLIISVRDEWRTTHPGASIGLLELSGVDNTQLSDPLDRKKRATEARLRQEYQGFTRKEFLSLPVMAAYARYYKQFNKTYHVQLQLESIVLKGKNLPTVSPLVDANFVAEVETFILTAGHDVDRLNGEVVFTVSREGDQITQLNGQSKPIRAGDMIMRDAEGVSCTILYGQDNRSPISAQTTHVLYVAYLPVGVPIQAVNEQFRKIEENVRLFSPSAVVERQEILSA